jgi:hypothetical protein
LDFDFFGGNLKRRVLGLAFFGGMVPCNDGRRESEERVIWGRVVKSVVFVVVSK